MSSGILDAFSELTRLPGWLYGLTMILTLGAVLPEFVFGFELSSSYRWANLGGRSIHWIYPAGTTFCLLILMLTLGIAVAAFVGLVMNLAGKHSSTPKLLLGWAVLWAAIILTCCTLAFASVHREIAEVFPDGYDAAIDHRLQ